MANARASTARAAPSASGNVEDQPEQRTDLDKWASASPGRDLNHAFPPLGAGSSANRLQLWIMHLDMEEYICFDRHPWWGPPENPTSECSGLWYADKHPGEFPWTMPQ
jgi:hypothetical protein